MNYFKSLMARKRFDDPSSKPGGFFDSTSYIGNFRSSIFFFLAIFVSRYFDAWGKLLWALRGNELVLTAGSMQFHAKVGLMIGILGLVMDGLLCIAVYRKRRPIPGYDYNAAYRKSDDEVAQRLNENAKYEKRQRVDVVPAAVSSLTPEQKLRKVIGCWPVVNDLLWGWPFLLGLSLIFFGKTMDGSPVAGLIGLFQLPPLSFFTIDLAPVSAMNGIFIGVIAYAINHAISKTPLLLLSVKLLINLVVGVLAVWVWHTLTVAMGASI